MRFEILSPGPLTTVQDMGRRGYGDKGWQESGCCDKYSLRRANRLAGNRADEAGQERAVLEMTLQGPSIRFLGDGIIALAGANMSCCLNGKALPMYRPIPVKEGDVFTSQMAVSGLRGYMAFSGGIDVPVVMGSRSTNIKCRTGDFAAAPCRPGMCFLPGKRICRQSCSQRAESFPPRIRVFLPQLLPGAGWAIRKFPFCGPCPVPRRTHLPRRLWMRFGEMNTA